MKSNTERILFVAVFIVCVVVLLFGIDRRNGRIEAQRVELEAAEARQVAVAAAVEQFRIVRKPGVAGDEAIAAESEITRILRQARLNFRVIGSSEAEVSRFVAEAYARDARKALADLKELKANPEKAKHLQADFHRYVYLSGKNLTSFVPNVNVVNEMVARNYIGAAKAQNARVGVPSLRQQGVAVGKASTVRKPTAKKATPKPAKRPTPTRRR